MLTRFHVFSASPLFAVLRLVYMFSLSAFVFVWVRPTNLEYLYPIRDSLTCLKQVFPSFVID
jgi:hypothetical protein